MTQKIKMRPRLRAVVPYDFKLPPGRRTSEAIQGAQGIGQTLVLPGVARKTDRQTLFKPLGYERPFGMCGEAKGVTMLFENIQARFAVKQKLR